MQVEREYPDFGGSRSTYPPEAGPRAVEVYQLLREKRNFNVVRFQLWQRGQPIDLSLLKQSLLALAPIHRVPIPVRRSAFVERQVEAILQSLEKRIRYSEWRTVLKGLPSEEDRRDFLTMHVSFMAGAKYIFDPFLGDTINAYQRENRPGEFTTAEIFKRGLHLEDATFLPEDVSDELNRFSLKRLLSLTQLQQDLEAATEADLRWANDHLELIEVLAQLSDITDGALAGPPQLYRVARSTTFQVFALLVLLRLSKCGYRDNVHLLLDALRIQVPVFQRFQALYRVLRQELPHIAKELPSFRQVSHFSPQQQEAAQVRLREVYEQNKPEIDAFLQRHPELSEREEQVAQDAAPVQ